MPVELRFYLAALYCFDDSVELGHELYMRACEVEEENVTCMQACKYDNLPLWKQAIMEIIDDLHCIWLVPEHMYGSSRLQPNRWFQKMAHKGFTRIAVHIHKMCRKFGISLSLNASDMMLLFLHGYIEGDIAAINLAVQQASVINSVR